MENETKKSKLTAKDILAKTGPGIIMAAAAVGTGTVTTSAILGARYEYGMIWMVILALFMRGIYMRSAYTAQVVLGMPILDCINKFYGKALCAIAGFVCAFGCVAYEVGNFSGSGISINLLFGLDWKIGGVIMSLVCLRKEHLQPRGKGHENMCFSDGCWFSDCFDCCRWSVSEWSCQGFGSQSA